MAAEVVDRETGELVGAEETLEFPRVRVDKKFVINQQGKDHVLFSGLIDALHQLSLGFFSVDTRIEQLPTPDNGHQAVCSACVRVYDPDNPDVVRRSASGIGDASPANVSRMMANALIRMAETRAKARALRDLCNIGMVAYEELGPQSADEPGERREEARASVPAPGAQHIVVEGRTFSREEVQRAWHQRVNEARRAGLAGVDELERQVPGTTPLAVLVGQSQELKRRLEAKAGAGK
jgi:hypothetical protein